MSSSFNIIANAKPVEAKKQASDILSYLTIEQQKKRTSGKKKTTGIVGKVGMKRDADI